MDKMIEQWALDCDMVLSTEFFEDHVFSADEAEILIKRFDAMSPWVSGYPELPIEFADQLFYGLTSKVPFDGMVNELIETADEYWEEFED